MPTGRYKHYLLAKPKKYNSVEEFELKCSEYFLKMFKDIDIDLWERCDKNPVKFLKLVDQDKLEEAVKNQEVIKLQWVFMYLVLMH